MLTDELLKLFHASQINPKSFDHFDYAQAIQKLKQDYNPALDRNPTKKKIVQQFIQKAYQQINQNDPHAKKQKVQHFLKRMQINQKIHQQKLQALRFINQNYDSKSKQLLFYPNINKKPKWHETKQNNQFQIPLSASRNYWNQDEEEPIPEIDQIQTVEQEKPIMQPNLTDQFSDEKH